MKRTEHEKIMFNMYSDAIHWIADNDNPAGEASQDDLMRWISVALVADVFNRPVGMVARHVYKIREARNEKNP